MYAYINPTTVVPYLSASAPAWDDAKQGYYLAASPTHRCYMQLYKDTAGNYDQKTIITGRNLGLGNDGVNLGIGANADRSIRLASDASIAWDESESEYVFDNDIKEIRSYIDSSGVLLQSASGVANDFYIIKPISAFLYISAGVNSSSLDIYQNGSWRVIVTIPPAEYNLQLNPGYYRLIPGAATTVELWGTGIFGATSLTVTTATE